MVILLCKHVSEWTLDYHSFDYHVVSFVDRDMVMCYFGGGIGHLKNAPPLQAPGFDLGPIDPSSEEMAVEEDDDDPCSSTNDDLGTVVQQPSRDIIMNGGELVQLEVTKDDKVDEDNEEETKMIVIAMKVGTKLMRMRMRRERTIMVMSEI